MQKEWETISKGRPGSRLANSKIKIQDLHSFIDKYQIRDDRPNMTDKQRFKMIDALLYRTSRDTFPPMITPIYSPAGQQPYAPAGQPPQSPHAAGQPPQSPHAAGQQLQPPQPAYAAGQPAYAAGQPVYAAGQPPHAAGQWTPQTQGPSLSADDGSILIKVNRRPDPYVGPFEMASCELTGGNTDIFSAIESKLNALYSEGRSITSVLIDQSHKATIVYTQKRVKHPEPGSVRMTKPKSTMMSYGTVRDMIAKDLAELPVDSRVISILYVTSTALVVGTTDMVIFYITNTQRT